MGKVIKFETRKSVIEHLIDNLRNKAKGGGMTSIAFTGVASDGTIISGFWYEEDLFTLLGAVTNLELTVNREIEE